MVAGYRQAEALIPVNPLFDMALTLYNRTQTNKDNIHV